MIPVDELIYELELAMNKLDRNDNQSVLVENKVILLNQAQISWIKNKMGQNNIYRAGFESTRKRIDDIQNLIEYNKELTVTKTATRPYTYYTATLSSVNDYMFYVSSSSLAKKQECEHTIDNNLIRIGELQTLMVNTNSNPNFEWRETLTTLGNNEMQIYVDGFEILKIYLTYVRYPKKIDKEGYVDFNGVNSKNQDCELPYYAKQDIVDLAVKFASQATENFPLGQAAEDRLNKNSE